MNEYRVLIQRNGGESERIHFSHRQLEVGEIVRLASGENVTVRKIVAQPSAAGPGVVEAEDSRLRGGA